MSKKIYSLKEIKDILSKTLKDFPVYKVILFGSYAKNNANINSDLDFIIDTKEELIGFKFYSLITKLESIFGKDIDGFEQSEIIENTNLDSEIRKTGVIVYEK